MAHDITLIVTNWNGRDLLRECLPTLKRAVENDPAHSYEVMVIDDCGSDDSLSVLEKDFPWVRAEKTPRNLGFQGANNHAAKLADSPVIMLLNNDIKLHPESLSHLAKHFDDRDNPVFAASGRIYDFDETSFLYGNRGGYFRHGHFHLYEKDAFDKSQTLFACGGAMMVDRERYLELGGFDSLYHPLYYEEIDLSYRALKRGWEVVYDPESIAYHKVRGTITRQKKLKQIGRISARNNYLFVIKNILNDELTREFLWAIPLYLLRDLFSGRFRFWAAIFMALPRLPQALKSRKREKTETVFDDGEILNKINSGRHNRKPAPKSTSSLENQVLPVSL
ncbi:MAG: glycosyltransferase family 2 protein [Candidatus Nitronauta litoralis]|uniref:Glycosyltransferase family 2 protein n=1 Tax=Candidatus Nitronauta litoralis TaxID=2705533 RepID=A0A7T0BXC9_9BACT|nr:MAG: glycosyltransferase family 2 protein [Candidatus Nitronauta litoralis]